MHFGSISDHFGAKSRSGAPKAAKVDPGGPPETPIGSQKRPKSSHLEPKVGPETPPECQRDPRGGPWGDFGFPLGGFRGALGGFWHHFGHLWTIFCALCLNQGKPWFRLEKRSPGALGGEQDAGILNVLMPKIWPKSTHGAAKRAKE